MRTLFRLAAVAALLSLAGCVVVPAGPYPYRAYGVRPAYPAYPVYPGGVYFYYGSRRRW